MHVEKSGDFEPKAGTIGIVALHVRHDGKRVTVGSAVRRSMEL
jgi:hypothetical protein